MVGTGCDASCVALTAPSVVWSVAGIVLALSGRHDRRATGRSVWCAMCGLEIVYRGNVLHSTAAELREALELVATVSAVRAFELHGKDRGGRPFDDVSKAGRRDLPGGDAESYPIRGGPTLDPSEPVQGGHGLRHRRPPLCGARAAPSSRIRADRRPVPRARDWRHERGVQRRVRRADQSVSLRRRRSDDAALLEGQRGPLPLPGPERRAVGPAAPGANGRERGGRRRVEPDDDGRRYSRGRRRIVRLAQRAEPLGCPRAHGAMAHPGGRASGSGSRAGRRPWLPVLAAVLLGRSGSHRPNDPARAEELSGCRRDAAPVPMARGGHLHAAEGEVRPQHQLRRQPQDPSWRLHG